MSDPVPNDPASVMKAILSLEHDFAIRQNTAEDAARKWVIAKREKEHDRAVKFISAIGTVAERNAIADRETCLNGKTEEADHEAHKAVVRVLEARLSALQSVGRMQARG